MGSTEEGRRLYNLVKGNRSENFMRKLLRSWIEEFRDNNDAGMETLFIFFSYCTGCIPPCDLGTNEMIYVSSLEEKYVNERHGICPLKVETMRHSLTRFVIALVSECHRTHILFHTCILSRLFNFLSRLSISRVRSFRHVGTYSLIKLAVALIKIGDNFQDRMQQSARKIESLSGTEEERNANESILAQILNEIFFQRIRDVDVDIRKMCLIEFGDLICTCPRIFLNTKSLNCIGDRLADENQKVQFKCLGLLQQLYKFFGTELNIFTKSYKQYIVQLMMITDTEIATKAVKLLTVILAWSKACNSDFILGDNDCTYIYNLVFQLNQPLARAAGEFLFRKHFDADQNKSSSKLILDLITFLEESQFYDRVDVLVDSMSSFCPFLKDWNTMTTLLLEDKILTDKQKTLLVSMMISSIKQNVSTDLDGSGKILTPTVQTEKDLTYYFLDTLPILLEKYFADQDRVSKLLLVSNYLDLFMYETDDNGKVKFQTLLNMLYNIFEFHTDNEILLECSKTITNLFKKSAEIPGIYNLSREMKDKCIGKLVLEFKSVLKAFLQETNTKGSFVESSNVLINSVKKLAIFEDNLDVSNCQLWKSFIRLMKLVYERKTIPKVVLSYAFSFCLSEVVWRYQKLDKEAPNKENLAELDDHLKDLMKHCCKMLENKYAAYCSVQDEAFLTLCDLMQIFRKDVGLEHPGLQELVCYIDLNTKQLILRFIEYRVFDNDLSEIDLSVCKNILSQFCNLILFNILPSRMSMVVLRNLKRFGSQYCDIMNYFAQRLFKINREHFGKLVSFSLINEFLEMKQKTSSVDQQTIDFAALELLSDMLIKFMITDGEDKSVVALHLDGIKFVAKDYPSNVHFLCILCRQVNKLSALDKYSILRFLENFICSTGSRLTEQRFYREYQLALNADDHRQIV